MDIFVITNSSGFQRIEKCEYYELFLEEDDISIIKITDEDIKKLFKKVEEENE